VILVDTSVWIHHLRWGHEQLRFLLENGHVQVHQFVIGELSCGSIKNRRTILELLAALPSAAVAEDQEVLSLIESRKLYGRGLGWVDMHLLTSALLNNAPLWSLDRKLKEAAAALRISYPA
jgi:predicted nucleic acid-binding protein